MVTDDLLRKYDSSCVTYDILLAYQVKNTPPFENKYQLVEITLKNRSHTQPAGPRKLGVHVIVFIMLSSVILWKNGVCLRTA
ncbi:hypothetical protein P879_09629 [Paragonimus westermani]|uniref:Uncharacterized protein n=1 Tax=Paragonimus westermani TaxID=34504 RepID=A0A8T0DN64_9TREM|nr:hypothetical protein P879_09629 [Paragonimus westermani]